MTENRYFQTSGEKIELHLLGMDSQNEISLITVQMDPRSFPKTLFWTLDDKVQKCSNTNE